MKKRNKKPNLKKIKYDPRKVTMAPMFLGNVIMKYELPKNMINDINSSYDEAKELPEWNNHLAGKIEEEKLVNELMTEDMLSVFLSCFATYIQYIQKNQWIPTLSTVWINEMRAGEYNPSHYHTSAKTDVGLSSVLVLKRPSSYGKEICTPNDPCNGHLEFTGFWIGNFTKSAETILEFLSSVDEGFGFQLSPEHLSRLPFVIDHREFKELRIEDQAVLSGYSNQTGKITHSGYMPEVDAHLLF